MPSPTPLKPSDLYAPPFLRRCNIEHMAQPKVDALRAAMLREENVQSDFSIGDAPLPPLDQTRFRWIGNDRVLLLGVAFPHSAHAPVYPDDMETESLELLLDLRGDGIGYQQFIFGSNGDYHEYSHLPYAEMHSSAYPLLKPTKWECDKGEFTEYLGGMGCRWFWVWFDAREVFRYSQTVGFNLFRARAGGEFSGWNFPTGNGGPDATGFGVLCRSADAAIPPTYQKPKRVKAGRGPSDDFKLSVTYDPPDNIVYDYLTPERISEEVKLLKDWGIRRMYWIDYSNFPTLDEYPPWRDNMHKTLRACGDLVQCAAQQTHDQGLEFIVDFKMWDMGVNTTDSVGFKVDKSIPGAVLELENEYASAVPEIAEHPEWTLQANPEWQPEYSGPVTTLRFFSDEPIRDIKPSQIKLIVGDDNHTYKPYRGRFHVKQAAVSRPHERWTPAGNVREKGTARNWMIELSGLRLSTPYAALQIDGDEVALWQRGFRVMEAENAQGQRTPLTVATRTENSDTSPRYSFWKEWPGWANLTEPLLQRRRWRGNDFGFVLRQMPNMTTLLEPTYEGTRQIWLDRIAAILDAGADGINLRMFNHHNGVMNYLLYAFAPVVTEEFRSRFGREPQTTTEDYERVRRLRGEAFTEFVRDARKLANARGKSLMTQLESGIEVPPHLDTRMQLHIDWQRWLQEDLVDEVNLKFWTPYSRFVHEQVMPLATKHNVPTHVVSRNMSAIVIQQRALESIPRQVVDTKNLGFSGYNFYEAGDLYERNPAGGIWTKGLARAIVTEARDRVAAS